MADGTSFYSLGRLIAQGDFHIATFFTSLKANAEEVEKRMREMQTKLHELSQTQLTFVQRQLIEEMQHLLEVELLPMSDLTAEVNFGAPEPPKCQTPTRPQDPGDHQSGS